MLTPCRWQKYRFLGADLQIRKLYQRFQVFECICYFTAFFCAGFGIQVSPHPVICPDCVSDCGLVHLVGTPTYRCRVYHHLDHVPALTPLAALWSFRRQVREEVDDGKPLFVSSLAPHPCPSLLLSFLTLPYSDYQDANAALSLYSSSVF